MSPTGRGARRGFELGSDEIHVWRADLDSNAHALPAVGRLLAPEERERAGGFRFERDRDRYVLAHGVLRTILARYVAVTPEELSFRRGPHGRPELANSEVHFSLSRSHDLVLVAIGHPRQLGVDVEHVPSGVTLDVEACLGPRGRDWLGALPCPARRWAFLSGWTRLEAYSKARGDGLTSGLEELDLLLDPSHAPFLPPSGGEERHRRCWTHEFSPRRGYLGALAAPWAAYRVRYWQWRADELGDSTRVDALQVQPVQLQVPWGVR